MKKASLYIFMVVVPIAVLILANRPMQEMPGAGFMTSDGTYVNTEHLFSLKPPAGWMPTQKFPPELAVSAVVSFELPAEGQVAAAKSMIGMLGNAQANVMVRIWRWTTTVDKVVELMKRPGRALPYAIKSEGPITAGGIEGYRLHYAWGTFLNLEAGEHVEHYVARGAKVYLISYMTFKDIPFERYSREADAAMRSFRFVEKVTLDVANGQVVVDGKRHDRLPTTLYLTSGEPHTFVAEPRRPLLPWTKAPLAFAGWGDGDPRPSRTIVITKSETLTAAFRPQ